MKKITFLLLMLLCMTGAKADETVVNVFTGTQALHAWTSETDPETSLALSYGSRGELANAYLTDKIRITYTTTSESSLSLYIADPSGWSAYDGATAEVTYSASSQTYEYTISSVVVLEYIQQRGIILRGNNVTVTQVDLVKVDGRYDAVPVIIGSDGISTFGSSKNLNFEDTGVTPYYVSDVAEGSVTLTSVTITRAYAGYVVKGNAGTYAIPVADSEPEWLDAFHYLQSTGDYSGTWVYRSVYSDYTGTDDRATKIKTYYRYIFAKNSSNAIGFYLLATDFVDADSNPYYTTTTAHKAYLETKDNIQPTSGGARVALVFEDGSETTGINTVQSSEFRGQSYYTLDGRKLNSKPSKAGLYIVNGKKVIIK